MSVRQVWTVWNWEKDDLFLRGLFTGLDEAHDCAERLENAFYSGPFPINRPVCVCWSYDKKELSNRGMA